MKQNNLKSNLVYMIAEDEMNHYINATAVTERNLNTVVNRSFGVFGSKASAQCQCDILDAEYHARHDAATKRQGYIPFKHVYFVVPTKLLV